ncbi:hypothetical protein ACFL15_01165 [Patescibacteria group bacterium]
MIYFALFTLGYFSGVITFLFAFPPKVKEIEEQEKDALRPILKAYEEKHKEESKKAFNPQVELNL